MHHHHSHYHHHSAAVRIPFQCGVCQQQTYGINSVPQCAVCARTLCANCNHAGFCSDHFNQLSPNDQITVQSLVASTRQSPKAVLIIAFLPLLMIPITLMPVWMHNLNFNVFFPLLMVVTFGMMFLIIGLSIRQTVVLRKRNLAVKSQIATIISKYNFQSVPIPPNQTNPGAFTTMPPVVPTQRKTTEIPFVVKKTCQYCGYRHDDPNARFCTYCGKEL